VGHRLGIDIGGTFTDLVLIRPDGSALARKVSSTPDNYATAIVSGSRELLGDAGVDPADVDEIIHATTVAANAILEGKGAKTALLTTRGFRDVLEMRRLRIPELYNLAYDKPPPLVARRHRFEVDERVGPRGEVWAELDESILTSVVERLLADGIEAVAISFLHSYANPSHERRVAAVLRDRLDDDVYVTCSADILPEIREYERASTTVVNAYVGPVVRRYLGSLDDDLRAMGIDAPLRVMQSGGGISTADAAGQRPAHVIESGPAAGVMACARVAQQAGLGNVISLDMGGTTAKAALVEDGRAVKTSEYEVGAGINVSSRLIKGGGYAIKLPFIDVSEIGAGGGSIVAVDDFGRLTVGPRSAGADPGPVCYEGGGSEPTFADAMMTLGYLNPEFLAGGALRVSRERAERALEATVASRLSMPLLEAADGVFAVAVATMTRAVKAVTTYRGRDPRDFALFAFGGNGPVAAAAIASALDISSVIVPQSPGVFSALGLLLSDAEYDFAKTVTMHGDRLVESELAAAYVALEDEARDAMAADGLGAGPVSLTRYADMRYVGQAYELTIPAGETADVETMIERFADEHRRTYGHASDDPVQVVSVRVVARNGDVQGALAGLRAVGAAVMANGAGGERDAFFNGHGVLRTPVIDRDALAGRTWTGPLIVEEYDATCVVPPGWSATLDSLRNIRLERSAQ
jgi:N-methylhydantoinase A